MAAQSVTAVPASDAGESDLAAISGSSERLDPSRCIVLVPVRAHVEEECAAGLVEILYAAGGFLLTHRQVYEAIREHEQLPYCNGRFGEGFTPYFWPMVVPDGAGHWYLAEDFAFSERMRRAGFTVMADTRIRLQHVGRIAYTWEDAGSDRPRYASYTFSVTR